MYKAILRAYNKVFERIIFSERPRKLIPRMMKTPTTTIFDKHFTFVLSICNDTEHHK